MATDDEGGRKEVPVQRAASGSNPFKVTGGIRPADPTPVVGGSVPCVAYRQPWPQHGVQAVPQYSMPVMPQHQPLPPIQLPFPGAAPAPGSVGCVPGPGRPPQGVPFVGVPDLFGPGPGRPPQPFGAPQFSGPQFNLPRPDDGQAAQAELAAKDKQLNDLQTIASALQQELQRMREQSLSQQAASAPASIPPEIRTAVNALAVDGAALRDEVKKASGVAAKLNAWFEQNADRLTPNRANPNDGGEAENTTPSAYLEDATDGLHKSLHGTVARWEQLQQLCDAQSGGPLPPGTPQLQYAPVAGASPMPVAAAGAPGARGPALPPPALAPPGALDGTMPVGAAGVAMDATSRVTPQPTAPGQAVAAPGQVLQQEPQTSAGFWVQDPSQQVQQAQPASTGFWVQDPDAVQQSPNASGNAQQAQLVNHGYPDDGNSALAIANGRPSVMPWQAEPDSSSSNQVNNRRGIPPVIKHTGPFA